MTPRVADAHDPEREGRRQALREQIQIERERWRSANPPHDQHGHRSGQPPETENSAGRPGSAYPGLSPEARRALRQDLRQHRP